MSQTAQRAGLRQPFTKADSRIVKRPGKNLGSGRKRGITLDLRRELMNDQAELIETWAILMGLVRQGNIDAVRLRLAYAFGAPPTAQLVEHKGDVTIRVVRDDPAPAPVVAEARVVEPGTTPAPHPNTPSL